MLKNLQNFDGGKSKYVDILIEIYNKIIQIL